MTLAPETMKNGGLSELKNSSPIYIYINIANLAPLSPHIMAKKGHYYIIFAKNHSREKKPLISSFILFGYILLFPPQKKPCQINKYFWDG